MDYKDTVHQFLNGIDITVPIEDLSKFYRCLIETLDAMGDTVVVKLRNPLPIAYSLQKLSRHYVLSRFNHYEAEIALKVVLRILTYLAPDDLESQAESCRLLAMLLSAQGRYQDAQLCDQQAVLLALQARYAKDINHS